MEIPKELKFVWTKIENKKKVYLGIAATFFVSAISAVVPYIYGRLVDISIKPDSSAKLLLIIIILWALLSLIRDAVDRYSGKFAYEIGMDIFTILQVDVVAHIMNLPLQFHKEKKIGEVSNRINRGIDDLYNLIESTIFSFFPTIITFFVAIIILLFVEWKLTIILLVASIAYVAITFFYTKQVIKWQKKLNQAWDKAFGDRHDAMFNVETVKASTNEKFEYERNKKNFGKASDVFKYYRYIWMQMDKWQSTIFTLSFIIVFGLGVFMLRAGTMTPGKLMMFVGYISLLTAPLSRIADQYRRVKRSLTSFKRVVDYFSIAPEKDFGKTIDVKEIEGNIAFENVGFGYKKGQMTIKNISFEIKSGETVALVGESGVGKTTITNLIGRYFFPQEGKILIDGIDIKKFKLSMLRNNMAVVPQEVLLFNDTIENNIKYGNMKAKEKEIVEAAKAANAREFIEKFPKKYKQIVGERGIKLSTGQKQRIAIARAILRNPKILILDEATSALDSVSEKLVQEALNNLIKNRTTFIIAHRLSTIQHADKIIVLENGKIAEMGKHGELMQNPNGIYRNFWELQTAIEKVK